MPNNKIFKILVVLLILFLFLLKKDYLFGLLNPKEITKGPSVDSSEIFQGTSYEPVDKNALEVSILANNLFSPTRVKITPDSKHLIVIQITGEVLGFEKTENGWSTDPYLITKIDTKFPGFPPDEAGLVGIAFSKDYSENKRVFVLYTYKDKDEKVQNRISSFTVREKSGKLIARSPKLIFQANVEGNVSHQITDAISLNLEGENRLVFLIGEGFDGKKAQDPNLHAGKLMSIKEDGSDPKIHAMGIRNGYSLAINPTDADGKILISDTGPDKFDRLIYTNPFISDKINLGWNGNQEILAKPVPDPNFPKVKDMVIFRYPETRTFTGLAFKNDNSFLVTLFGRTGFKDNTPGKEILLGKLENLGGQPTVSLKTLIKRVKEADGKMGNPLGMEIDPKTNDFFFLDVIEGRLYQVKSKEGVNNK